MGGGLEDSRRKKREQTAGEVRRAERRPVAPRTSGDGNWDRRPNPRDPAGRTALDEGPPRNLASCPRPTSGRLPTGRGAKSCAHVVRRAIPAGPSVSAESGRCRRTLLSEGFPSEMCGAKACPVGPGCRLAFTVSPGRQTTPGPAAPPRSTGKSNSSCNPEGRQSPAPGAPAARRLRDQLVHAQLAGRSASFAFGNAAHRRGRTGRRRARRSAGALVDPPTGPTCSSRPSSGGGGWAQCRTCNPRQPRSRGVVTLRLQSGFGRISIVRRRASGTA